MSLLFPLAGRHMLIEVPAERLVEGLHAGFETTATLTDCAGAPDEAFWSEEPCP